MDQDRLRLVIGGVFTLLVWGLLLVRVTFGAGPMHDYEGNQAPIAHYVAGALTVTAVVIAWITLQALLKRKGR